ncbi:ATP-binding protein [Vulcanisaeta distributa]|uniref:ATPase n=1 Tax=Vulcanisaeta distributa (strain DSM 14429 / JCM 11212 / NBRC 100878 / IC-017) TaxID=572478 RepID=E1QUF5_VULDI|nr:ATP-binding protein [Vulcanisaeta distributa]ADN49881.1 ATPase [Vulcanisaeta distributa DSM 14429]
MRRIRLSLALSLAVEFVDRDLAMRRVEEWAEKGAGFPKVIYGPEGCGKTAWLLQSVELLRDYGFDVIYINPIEQRFMAEVGVEDVRKRLVEILREATSDAWVRAVWVIIDLARELIRMRRGRLAVIVDDAFQVIGLDKAAVYVKGLLGLIEHPPGDYEKIVTIVATSEGVSLREIGRHEWSDIMPMWNMPKEGFRQLYNQIPGDKPPFDEVWRITGGNPRMLERFYENNWSVDKVVNEVINRNKLRRFARSLSSVKRAWLMEAVNDPDTLFARERIPFMDRLVELNLIIDDVPERREYLWIDQPPPEKDEELGIGKYVAWQSPIHREAVKRVLESLK